MRFFTATRRLFDSLIQLIIPYKYTKSYLEDDEYIIIKTKGGA